MTESNCDPVKRGLRQGLKGFETRPWAGQTCGLRGRHGLCRVQRRREPQGPSAFERQGAGAADFGGMVEWFKAPVLKTGVGASSPWVRIPLPPPLWRSRPRSGLRGGAALAAGRVAPEPFGLLAGAHARAAGSAGARHWPRVASKRSLAPPRRSLALRAEVRNSPFGSATLSLTPVMATPCSAWTGAPHGRRSRRVASKRSLAPPRCSRALRAASRVRT